MSLYHYTALDQDGRKVRGALEAETVGSAHEMLERKGLAPLRLAEASRAIPASGSVIRLDRRALADFLHDAGGFHADAGGKRHGIQAAAEIRVGEIEAHRGVANARLARARMTDLDLLDLEDFGPAGAGESDGLRAHAAAFTDARAADFRLGVKPFAASVWSTPS